MPCKIIPLPGGGTALAFIRRPHRGPRTCVECKRKVGTYVLCDYLFAGKHCDVALCTKCAVHVEPDMDYCPLHAAALGLGRKLRL